MPSLRRNRLLLAAAAAVVALAALALLAWRDTTSPHLRTVRVAVPGLSRPYTLVHASDLHATRFGPRQAEIDRLLRGVRADAAVITGDLVLGADIDRDPGNELVRVLQKHADSVAYVRGNHDGQAVLDDLERAGVVMLEWGGEVSLGDGEVPVRAASAPPLPEGGRAVLTVLAAHTPAEWESARRRHGGRLLFLAGHTHGGQLRLPLLGAIWSPYAWDTYVIPPQRDGFLPDLRGRYVKGLYRDGGSWVHVSAGLGTSFVRLRLFDRSEITVIELVPGR